jgi:hypothetical protein
MAKKSCYNTKLPGRISANLISLEHGATAAIPQSDAQGSAWFFCTAARESSERAIFAASDLPLTLQSEITVVQDRSGLGSVALPANQEVCHMGFRSGPRPRTSS